MSLDKIEYLRKLRNEQRLLRERNGLPFLVNAEASGCNLHKFYPWQRDFFLCTDRIAFLTAANQIGKSSVQILKILNLATRKELWPQYFGEATPSLFVYMYPDVRTGKTEFTEKWEKLYLPQGEFKDHPVWGWRVIRDKEKSIESIEFNSGVTIYWRYYTQQTTTLQAMTADYVGLDEECPQQHWDELMVRTSARAGLGSGKFSMVFTATLGQEYLYQTMEMQGSDEELYPTAFKLQISLYDCLYYWDGTPSTIFTKERIENEIIPSYSSKREIQKRVWGRFVKDSGLIYQEFEPTRNTKPYDAKEIKDWHYWVGIDFGSGGANGHPSAFVIIAVNETYTKARVVFAWKSGTERVTQSDLLEMYVSIRDHWGIEPQTFYDGAATDLGELALREGVPMQPANKNHEYGQGLLNSLFSTGQLIIFTGGPSGQTGALIKELASVLEDTPKKRRKDDLADSLRYGLTKCPMRITTDKPSAKPKKEEITCPRMRFYKGIDADPDMEWGDDIDQALAEAAAMFEGAH
jgi:hypothetical protein